MSQGKIVVVVVDISARMEINCFFGGGCLLSLLFPLAVVVSTGY